MKLRNSASFAFHGTYEPAEVVANLIYHIEACLFNSLKKICFLVHRSCLRTRIRA